ncbi:MAG: exonuclease domain-containing protein [Saprospiraceae bacterium]
MKKKQYAIIDIETTGGKASRDKITEIAIILHDGEKIIESFDTLINPECYIPYGITQLTGITQEMVATAPKFYEVARKIVEMTEDTIFVAHNVRFDYTFIKEEFQRLGFTFSKQQLCTVRLSREAFPGLPSYSLENLIRHFNISVQQRHRAMADALATVKLFESILQKKENREKADQLINLGIKASKLPKNISLEQIHALPEACGVYYFYDQEGNVVYVGKSINIKKRIAEHFADMTEKGSKLQKHVWDITYELTGSELVALLLESYEIKRLAPSINRAQRMLHFPFVIHYYYNAEGYLCFEVAKVLSKDRKKHQILAEYPKLSSAKGHLARMLHELELCARFCHLQSSQSACFNYHIKKCRGACLGVESVADYNERAEQAKAVLSTVFEHNFFLLDQGRAEDELAVVMVENGSYRGYGYAAPEEVQQGPETLRDVIETLPGNPETTKIIQRFMSQYPSIKVIPF